MLLSNSTLMRGGKMRNEGSSISIVSQLIIVHSVYIKTASQSAAWCGRGQRNQVPATLQPSTALETALIAATDAPKPHCKINK